MKFATFVYDETVRRRALGVPWRMNLLLDTHVFLWAIEAPSRLSPLVRELLSNSDNELLLSAASLWEIALKVQSGKLDLPLDAAYFRQHLSALGVSRVLPVEGTHVFFLMQLPAHHKDPFDRMLVAQCVAERLTLVSRDGEMRKYNVPVVW